MSTHVSSSYYIYVYASAHLDVERALAEAVDEALIALMPRLKVAAHLTRGALLQRAQAKKKKVRVPVSSTFKASAKHMR